MRTALILLRLTLLLLVGLVSLVRPVAAQSGAPGRTATYISCTPTSITVDGRMEQTSNPIPDALGKAAPGCLILLGPGDYPSFRIGFNKGANNVKLTGGVQGMPIVVRGQGGVRIRAGSGGDTVSITQENPNAHITFENIEFEPSYRAAILFYRPAPGGVNEGYHFYDCNIIGSWDHIKGTGKTSKWGLNGKRLKDFEWIGRTRPSIIRDIRQEHAFYLSNMAGDTTIGNVEATRLGRTFVQLVSRKKDGPAGVGTFVVRDCKISDTCIAAGDNFKGGSAFTLAGDMPYAKFRYENNTYRAGFDKRLHKLTAKGAPYGTGAFAAWGEKENTRLGSLTLIDNDFRFAPGCGERPVVAITSCTKVSIIGSNHFESGGAGELPTMGLAVALDKPIGPGQAATQKNLSVVIAPTTTIVGRIEIEGREASESQRRTLGLK
jgi:hypothetical protein